MNIIQLLALLLALSLTTNLGMVAAWIAKVGGQSSSRAVLVGLGVIIPTLAVYFAAVAAYR